MKNNRNMNNFKDFILKYSIQIPLIQRDYVQGSDENKKKRDDFLKSLLDALKGGDAATLDFIYGTIDNKKNINCFEPLDGQQRLTTLSLLFWILRRRSSVSCDVKLEGNIKKFSYKTRISSTKFCEKLFSETRFPTGNSTVASFVKKFEWYSEDWDFDPTIKSMLQMLNAINTMLNWDEYKDYIDTIANNFYGNGNNNQIEFDELNMGQYHLTDGLYIKMNARGKQLTEFENWKASFIKFLSKVFANEEFDETYRGINRKEFGKYKEYFEQSIEHEWTYILWPYTYDSWKSLAEDDEDKQIYPVFDDKFLNLYKYLFKMLYFANTDKIKDISQDGNEMERDVVVEDFKHDSNEIIKDILGKKENIDFIFRAIDFFCNIDRNNFFNELFYMAIDDFHLDADKVRLFGTNNINFFELCLAGDDDKNFDVKSQIMLYCIIKYCLKYNCITVTDKLKGYVRVCRNLIESINQRLAKDLAIRPNLRLNDMKKYNAAIDKIIKCDNVLGSLNLLNTTEQKEFSFGHIEREIDKLNSSSSGTNKDELYKIEDLSFTRGNLTVFSSANLQSAKFTHAALNAFMKSSNIQQIQLLIASGFEGEGFGSCRHGNRTFFGDSIRWDIIFMSTNQTTIKAVNNYIQSFKSTVQASDEVKIKNIISSAISNVHNFLYYALSYDEFLSAATKWGSPHYYFSVKGTLDDFDIIALGSYSTNPLLAYHTEPFASAVATHFKNFDKAIYDDLKTDSIYSERASLQIISKELNFLCVTNGWLISSTRAGATTTIETSLVSKFSIVNNVLLDKSGKDRITTAIEFIKEIYK